MTEVIQKNETLPQTCACHAFCPSCGVDLYFRDNECICKNKDCSWTCDNCQKAV